jgi:tRNA U34 5-carboxymethylaminomethyl modifying GTPase MnmE/TrmE
MVAWPSMTINQTFNQDFRGAQPGVFSRAHIFKEQIKQETIQELAELIDSGGTMAQITGRRRRRP